MNKPKVATSIRGGRPNIVMVFDPLTELSKLPDIKEIWNTLTPNIIDLGNIVVFGTSELRESDWLNEQEFKKSGNE